MANEKIQIIDDDVTTIRDDIEKVQRKPLMYISYAGADAVGHLSKEVENNCIDEYNNPRSVSKGQFNVFYDYPNDTVYFQDDGRGIAFEELENVCTILQSGSKMDRDYGNSAGENGVGLTVTNALSEFFEITSTREGKSKQLRFKEGKKISDKIVPVKNKSAHGLTVAFKPSKYFLGDTASFPYEEFADWNSRIFFFEDPEMKLTFTIDGLPGKAAPVVQVFQNKTGIGGYIPTIFPEAKLLPKPVVISTETKLVESGIVATDDSGAPILIDKERTMKLEVSFNYDPESTTNTFMSYCNSIENIQGGYHQVAVKTALSSYFVKAAKETAKKTDPEVTADDVISGIYVVLSVSTDMNPGFESQTKHKLGNKAFYEPLRKLCMSALTEYFKYQENQKTLKVLLDNLRINAKLRTDSTKARKKAKGTTSFMQLKSNSIVDYTPANFINSPAKIKDGEKLELFIVEGNSAAGLVRAARYNADYQGVLATRGRPTNIWEMSAKDIFDKKDMWDWIFNEVLGCGYGRNFDESRLKYKRIVLGSDADVDGYHIFGLFLAGIIKHAPALVANGYVFRAVTPLYRLASTKKKKKLIDPEDYLYFKADLFARFEKNVSSRIRLKFNESDDKFISQINMKRFLEVNRDYFQTLDELRINYQVDIDILEYMASHDDYMDTIQSIAPELVCNKKHHTITGPYNGKHQTIILDETVLDKLKYLSQVINVGNDGILYYCMYEKSRIDFEYVGRLSIGHIMTFCQKYWPDVRSRFKGLGEMTKDECYEMMMNPENRVMIQFTMNDAKRVVSRFDDLFSKSGAPIRKKLVATAEVSLDDIDN